MQKNTRQNFDNVRLGLALIVFFYHAIGLSNESKLIPFTHIFDAHFAVKGFFAISGYLIFQSYINSYSFLDYFKKRIRRIYPAYLFAILICILIGFISSKPNRVEFLYSEETISYVLSNVVFLNFLKPNLPGVFESNPLHAVNGSLWTIKVEVMLYAIVPLIAYSFKRINPIMNYFFILIFGALWVFYFEKISLFPLSLEISRQFPGQLPFFGFGCAVAARPALIRWLPLISFFGISILFITDDYLLRLFIEPVSYSSFILFLCILNPKKFNFGKIGDLSYGIYLFHFPIVQFLINIGLYKYNPYLGLLVSFIVTIFLSYFSWHFIEKRFLKKAQIFLNLSTK